MLRRTKAQAVAMRKHSLRQPTKAWLNNTQHAAQMEPRTDGSAVMHAYLPPCMLQ
jgi:hypothetical protein